MDNLEQRSREELVAYMDALKGQALLAGRAVSPELRSEIERVAALLRKGLTPGMVVEVERDLTGVHTETVMHKAMLLREVTVPKWPHGRLVIEMLTGSAAGEEYYAHPEELRGAV